MTLEAQKQEELFSRKSIHTALKAWGRAKTLGKHPLAQLNIVEEQRLANNYSNMPAGYGLALREVLNEAILSLKPDEPEPTTPQPKRWRSYFILTQRFIDGRSPEYIQECLAIGSSMYFVEQRKAWDRLADLLRAREEEVTAEETVGADVSPPPPPPPPPPPLWPLPGVAGYRELVGRDSLVDEIIAVLRDTNGRSMVAIDGMGGIGKTALAYEVTERSLEEEYFDNVVWVSASRSDLLGETHSGTLTFETVLDTIGQQLGVPDIVKLKLAQKKFQVQALLKRQAILVVLDNLETAFESQHEIARQLQPLLVQSSSKALLTSRYRFTGPFYMIHLTGLEQNTILQLILSIAQDKGMHRVVSAQFEPEELQQIAQATGGSPLALQLVVSMLDHLPLEVVLEHLRQVQPISDTGEDQYIAFYKFIFWKSWQLLTEESQELLIAMGHFASGIGGNFNAVMMISGLPRPLFIASIDELWRLSFLEVGDVPNLRQMRYYLHALTRHFVLADIVQML